MTCDRWTRSPEAAEENSFRPHFQHVEFLEIDLLDDKLEGFEELMSCRVFLDVDDVDAHRNDVRSDLIARDAGADAPHVAIDGKRGAGP